MNPTNQSRYPSAEEIRQCLAAKLNEINKATHFAEYDDPPTLPIRYRSVVGEKGMPRPVQTRGQRPDREGKPPVPLLGEHFSFLREIVNHPSDGLKGHYDRLGFGIAKANRLLVELKAAGCVNVTPVPTTSPSGGRGRVLASLTPHGVEILNAYEQRA
jgi:hypothetical protein